MQAAQQKAASTRPQPAKLEADGLWMVDGKVWVPDSDVQVKLKLFVSFHCGQAGHRGTESTLSCLRELYHWDGMDTDCAEFTTECLNCVVGKMERTVPRPLSLTLHAEEPNEVVHFDHLYMGPGLDNLCYVLVIQDDLSSCRWLCPTRLADAECASTEIGRWIRVFSAMHWWVSNQGCHFRNRMMQTMASTHRIRHSFTAAYSPWVNGTVENAMRHVRVACTSLLFELRLGPQDWPLVISMVMSALNEAPLTRRGRSSTGTYLCPLEVMTGISRRRAEFRIDTLSAPSSQNSPDDKLSISEVRLKQLLNIQELHIALDNLHKDVSRKVEQNRKRHIALHNKKKLT